MDIYHTWEAIGSRRQPVEWAGDEQGEGKWRRMRSQESS
jgi:hypothetical protein